MKILIVDDAEARMKQIRNSMNGSEGPVTIRRVSTPTALREALADDGLDAVLCAHQLLRFREWECLEVLSQMRPDLPLIVLCEKCDSNTLAESLSRGATDCVGREDIWRLAPVLRRESNRQRASEGMTRRGRKIAAIADLLPDVIFHMRLSPTPHVDYINSACKQMLGRDPEEFLSDPMLYRRLIHPDDLAQADVLLAKPESSHTAIPLTFLHKDGHEVLCEVTLSIEGPTADGEVFVQGVVRDVTKEHLLRNQLHVAHRMEAVGRLVGGIAHEFNNTMTVIGSYSGLLLDAFPEGHPGRNDAKSVIVASERAASFTRKLLAFSRRELYEIRPVDLNAIIRDMESLIQRLIGEQIDVNIETLPEPVWVLADRGQIEQIIVELVVNARDAMPRGGHLTVHLGNQIVDRSARQARSASKPGTYVALTVQDTGVGISQDIQAKVFDPFFTTKPMDKGTGLGLSTVYGIVQDMDGYISLESKVGEGTAFTVYLVPASATDLIEQKAPDLPKPPGANDTVLLVEDEDAVRTATRRILTSCGYSVIEARTPDDGIALWREHRERIRLIVSDMVMPGMSGAEMLATLEAVPEGFPILFISGYSDEHINHINRLKFNCRLLSKPFNKQLLLGAISGLMHTQPPKDGRSHTLPT